MNSMTVNTEGIDRLIGKIKTLGEIDFSPLMFEWRGVLEQDNEEGAFAGLDGFGVPLADVTYRPNPNLKKPTDFTIQVNNNLTNSHYRTLGGPPLAPRGAQSRLITNFRTDSGRDGSVWVARGMWEDFLSLDGQEILPFHAGGQDHNPKLPVRDVLQVRPTAFRKAQEILIRFVSDLLRRTFH